jgi:HK97 family phage prohead protease
MSELLKREFAAEASVGDGRTIDLRMVPYDEVATVDDGDGPYQEEFAPGAFDGQTEHAHRVYMNFQHEKGIRSVVGKGVTLESRPDALYGSFRAFEDADGDKALLLVREGVLTGASIEFMPKKGGSIRTAAGVVRRIKAHLDAVALCRVGAYVGAGVLGTRGKDVDDEDDHHVLEAELMPVDMDPERVERLRALGIALPDRYLKAHPAEKDTPPEGGTSDDGTRQPTNTLSSEE